MFVEKLNVNVRTVDVVEKHTAVEFEKSPVKLLIDKYQNMRVENESTIVIGQSAADVAGMCNNSGEQCQACEGWCQAKSISGQSQEEGVVCEEEQYIWMENGCGE